VTFSIILTLALAADIVGITLFEFLMNRPWRYKGRNIKKAVRFRLSEKWLHGRGRCGNTFFCRDCRHFNECVAEIVNEVKAEIDAEEGGAK